MTFKEKLISAARKNRSWLCVGLDPELSKIPENLGRDINGLLKFNKGIIDSTCELVCAYKPNAAFYEAHGLKGWELLHETIEYIPDNIPVILDCKRGDIGNTSKMYAQSAFDILGADAVTVNPYMGKDSVEPFLSYKEKGVFILCLTSNPSAMELQRRIVLLEDPPLVESMTPQAKARTFAEFFGVAAPELFMHVAGLAGEWNEHGNAGLVVGATKARDLEAVRAKIGNDMPILIPGVGAQGGDLEQSIALGSNRSGELAIINIARGVIYAGSGADFQTGVRAAALDYRDRISAVVEKKNRGTSKI